MNEPSALHFARHAGGATRRITGKIANKDSDGKTEIITDIKVKRPRHQGSIKMEVKVDGGAYCIPLRCFRHPLHGVLQPSLAELEAYRGETLDLYGWFILEAQHIGEKKFHPLCFYVVDHKDTILPSHASSMWIGLVKVMCHNKAKKCKQQLAAVKKKVPCRITTPSQSDSVDIKDEVYQVPHRETQNSS